MITLQNILTLQISLKVIKYVLLQAYNKSHDTSEWFDMGIKLSTLHVEK